jgi:hypothetical protein
MHLICTRAQALFPPEGFKVLNDTPLSLLWDCHHGDTFVLMVKGLKVESLAAEAVPGSITLEMSLAPFSETLATIENFAAHHNLALASRATLPEELEEPLTLAACHLPDAKLFVYSEKALLTARATPEGTMRLTVTGDFKSRKVPCQETDLLLHLERPGSTRLLSYCFSVIRGRS